jgi:hypothetical protein
MDNTQPNGSGGVEEFLLRYGIQVGFLVSGFFGSLLLVSKNSAQRLRTTIASIMAGMACANYLTPVVIGFLPQPASDSAKYAIAFALGFMGLKSLEMFIDKYLSSKPSDPQPVLDTTQEPSKTQHKVKTRKKKEKI